MILILLQQMQSGDWSTRCIHDASLAQVNLLFFFVMPLVGGREQPAEYCMFVLFFLLNNAITVYVNI